MKEFKIKELIVSNFRAQNFHDVYDGDSIFISGRNATGKSTRFACWQWLLTGWTDANSPANANLYDNRYELNENTPTASVKAIVTIDNEQYSIERTAKAKYQRRRGTNTWEKASSDEYHMFVNDIERNNTDFKEWLNENIAPDDMLRYVLDGQVFINLCYSDKKKARQLIEKVVGTVSREEMKGDYTEIEEDLKRYTLDEIEERSKNMSSGINQRLNEIPSLIQSKETEIAEIEQTDFEGNEKEIAKLEHERDNLDKRMTDLSERVRPQMDAKYKAERDKQMKQDVFDKAYEDWKKSFDVRRQKLTDEIAAIRQQNAKSENARKEAEQRQELAKSDLKSLEAQLANLNEKRNRLVAERDAEKEKKLDPSATICPHCGAELQGEKLQSVIDNFEKVKRERINAIVTDGKDTGDKIKRIKESIETTKKLVEEPLPQVITQQTDELEKQVLELANTDTSRSAFMETKQGMALTTDLASVVIPEVVMPDNSEIVAAKKEANDKLTPLYERRGLKSRLQSLKEGIEVLRTEQKEKGSELAKYERQRQLVKDYKQEQMEILSHKVNDGLKFSRIECWSKQKDGQVVADLVIKDAQGVAFAVTNNAARIVTTCDIQRFFCEKLNINAPVWVDECSVLDTENMPSYEGSQMFYMFRADTGLTIESK